MQVDSKQKEKIIPARGGEGETAHQYAAEEGCFVMTTGKKAASDAAKILRDPKSTKKEREVAGSDLAQAKKAPAKPVKR